MEEVFLFPPFREKGRFCGRLASLQFCGDLVGEEQQNF